MLADDLDQALHPHLLRYLISLYKNREKNPHNAQLVFTAHNTAILTPGVMRRDEIYLCCRPEGKDAVLYPLSSYKKENGLIPRNDEAYGKQYLEGQAMEQPQNLQRQMPEFRPDSKLHISSGFCASLPNSADSARSVEKCSDTPPDLLRLTGSDTDLDCSR